MAILHSDHICAQALARRLRSYFSLVLTPVSVQELREIASRLAVDVAIVDVATVSISDVCGLRLGLGVQVVCTHRLANETMWMQALEAGALDCCYDDDAAAIIRGLAANTRQAAA